MCSALQKCPSNGLVTGWTSSDAEFISSHDHYESASTERSPSTEPAQTEEEEEGGEQDSVVYEDASGEEEGEEEEPVMYEDASGELFMEY